MYYVSPQFSRIHFTNLKHYVDKKIKSIVYRLYLITNHEKNKT